ncbi:MAG: hypothetical protein JWO30_3215 [Fibrobacteres bacterium]|nr:hypothetical protein [Fibrobacterota bacterium]
MQKHMNSQKSAKQVGSASARAQTPLANGPVSKALTVALAAGGWWRAQKAKAAFLAADRELGLVSRGFKPMTGLPVLPAIAALALALGAWGRSGPEHRTLRPLAMGNAFVAVADDKDAMHYNPAGLNLMGRLGNANLRPEMSRYPLDKFDMHMDFLGTAIPVNEALDILKFYQDHQSSFQNSDALQNDSNLVSDLSAFDRRPVKVAVLHGGELAMHNFGMAYWADAQMAPYADVGVLLPQAGVEFIQLDIVGQIAAATSYFDDRLSVGLGYRLAKRERMENFQVALTDLSNNSGRKTVQEAIQDSVDEKLSEFGDLGTLGHAIDAGVMWQQTADIRFGAAVQNLFMVLNHQSVTPDFTVGVAYSPMRLENNGRWKRKINFAMDLEDLLNNDRNYKPLNKVNMGAEWEQTLIPWVLKGRLSVGMKGGYPTAGLGGTLFTIFHYEAATWAEEAGYYTGQLEDRYYVMKFGVGI